ncbi:hypothetical protein [Actinomadura xylanilytica]|uniref:hypothetical protein n=1 Tax=Actinomadura xylanilytica TaxID=887459 RepID=UPI00255AB348|nr:hypothetical protein [Actinomadura xylanilytica]MDL4771624.1 hypothetical protein [Actinomadura xylanilytica]
MIALARFQFAGYVLSLRVLQPLIVVLLIIALVLGQGPGGANAAELAVGTFGDVAAFMFPVWAWSARALLDTQPDEQRNLSATAARRRTTPTWAGLLAAYSINVCLSAVILAIPLIQAAASGVQATPIVIGTALNLLVAAAGTLLGAWTSRAIIPDPGVSLLALLGGAAALLLLSLGPLDRLSVPMIGWLHAAHHGPDAFITDFPGIALHLAAWSVVVGIAYLLTKRHRP